MAAPQIRRVVLGPGEDDHAVVCFDGAAPAITELPAVPGTALVDLWRSEAVPLTATASDPTLGDFELMPAGSLFRIIDLAPTGDDEPMWHRTASVDFIYVAAGAVTCRYRGGSVDLVAGDSIVQQGIEHAWVNDGPGVCRLINVSVALA